MTNNTIDYYGHADFCFIQHFSFTSLKPLKDFVVLGHEITTTDVFVVSVFRDGRSIEELVNAMDRNDLNLLFLGCFWFVL